MSHKIFVTNKSLSFLAKNLFGSLSISFELLRSKELLCSKRYKPARLQEKKSLIQETNVDHMSTERSSLKSLESVFYWFIFSKFTAYRNTLLVKGNCL